MIQLVGVRDLTPWATSHRPRQGGLSGSAESPDHPTRFQTCLITTDMVETQVRPGLVVVSPCVSLFQWHLILLSNTGSHKFLIPFKSSF